MTADKHFSFEYHKFREMQFAIEESIWLELVWSISGRSQTGQVEPSESRWALRAKRATGAYIDMSRLALISRQPRPYDSRQKNVRHVEEEEACTSKGHRSVVWSLDTPTLQAADFTKGGRRVQSAPDLVSNYRLLNCRNPSLISSGEDIVLTTEDLTTKPLPSLESLELQWILNRVCMLAAAGPRDYENENEEDEEDEGDTTAHLQVLYDTDDASNDDNNAYGVIRDDVV